VIRNAFTAVVVAVMIGTLVLGGCLSCRQGLSQRPADNSCCKPTGQCEKSGPVQGHQKDCQSFQSGLEQFVKVELHLDGQLHPASDRVETLAAALPDSPLRWSSPLPGYSPPDLFLLHSSLLI